MVNIQGKKILSSVLSILLFLSIFLGLPKTADSVNAVSIPTNLKVVEYSDKAAKLSWNKVSGATGYLVYYSKDNSAFTKLKTIASQSTISYTVGNLVSGKSYYFALVAYTDVNGKITKSVRTPSIKVTATSSSSVPAPTGLKIAEYSNSAVKLTWTKPSSATGYYIYRSTDGKTYSKIKTLSASTTSYTNTSLTSGKKYYYTIASYKKTSTGATAIGPKSSAVSVVTTSSSSVPAPTGLKIAEYSNSAVKLTWTKPSSATGYYIYRSTDGKTYSKIKALSASTTSYTNTSLTSSKKYYYTIASYKKTSTGAIAIGPKSSAVNITTTSSSTLPYPSGFAVKECSPKAIKLAWNTVSGASGYYIYRSNDNKSFTKIKTVSANSFTDSNLYSGTKYYYRIASYKKNSSGTVAISSRSSSVNASTTINPVSITGTSSASSSTITIKWEKYHSATGYQVFRLNQSTGNYERIGSTTSTSYTDKGLSPYTRYYYKVRAYTVANGITSYSSYDMANEITKPKAVANFKATTITYYSISLSWSSSSLAKSYEIYQLAPNEKSYKLIATLKADTTSYMVNNLNTNSEYKFRIRLNTMSGSSSCYSDYATASATTKAVTNELKIADDLYNAINNYRASKNLGKLDRNKTLDSLAAIRAKEITTKFSDTRPDGTSWSTVLEYAGLENYYYTGENIATGMKTVNDVLNVWLDREVESSNIKSSNYKQMGVAMCYKGTVPYYTVIFYRAM